MLKKKLRRRAFARLQLLEALFLYNLVSSDYNLIFLSLGPWPRGQELAWAHDSFATVPGGGALLHISRRLTHHA